MFRQVRADLRETEQASGESFIAIAGIAVRFILRSTDHCKARRLCGYRFHMAANGTYVW
ncbi:hypothetical protein D3OALGA1CA_2899 [Olavius algarvensis associated proteobacterium Delta 3]|nr:hypothetical protein D3OALGB2SA_2732 [Olavius algarvensis associated proteobacterium Delta 3]CAB5125976.1 hypothetical protein D3OALGA1CA_2899 [Olavius algarvensis associated proteobacterium Delta 3]